MESFQKEYENSFKKIIGLTLTKVEYAEIAYDKISSQSAPPYYKTQFNNIHSVDYSVFLYTKQNKRIEIYWGSTFFQYGIEIKVDEKSDFDGYQIWDVSNSKMWQEAIGQKISNVDLEWEAVTTINDEKNNPKKIIYPQYLKIIFFNNKKIFISAAGFLNNEDTKVFGMSDNLIICNDEIVAKRSNIIS